MNIIFRVRSALLFKIGIAIVIIIGLYYGASKFISLEQIKQQSVQLALTVEEHYAKVVVLYIALVMVLITLSLPVMIPLTLAGGFLFGSLLGGAYATLGATIGCVNSFLLFRYALHKVAKKKEGSALEGFKQRSKDYGPHYLLLLHYSAVIPFFVINSVAAATSIKTTTFACVTLLGIFPLSVIYAFAGRQLGTIHSVKDVFSPHIIVALVLLMLLAVVPLIIKRLKGPIEV